jgi:hypothetical protein
MGTKLRYKITGPIFRIQERILNKIRLALGLLPRGWFLAEGANGFWVVYDANLEPQAAEKSVEKAIGEALAFAQHVRG